jgi:hypothetical protein
MSTNSVAQKKLLTTLNDFKLRGFRDMHLTVTDNAQMILLATEKRSETENTEHQRIIYTPRSGMTRTASKSHLSLYQTLNSWSRQNPGHCRDGSEAVHNMESAVYAIGGIILFIIAIYAVAQAFH